jgi:hypothetical protein
MHPSAGMGYYAHAQVAYDRNMHGAIPGGMPTPQDYPMTLAGRFANGPMMANGNGIKPPNQSPSRPPAPATMMTTFSSKTVSSTPKRYKCNTCQKRFTRPSSLQTHMYSHTGEKRACIPFLFLFFDTITWLIYGGTRETIAHSVFLRTAFKCPVEGCGRHFSVVSNLRRHQKIHATPS